MKCRGLLVLLVVGVILAGAGVALAGHAFGAASFGWTAYSPLTDASYQPITPAWLIWAPKIGLALLAVGAGTAGAAGTALVLDRSTARRRSEPSAR